METLLAHIPPEAAPLRRELRKTLAAIRKECGDLPDLRHRRIAHRDYAVTLAQEFGPDRVRVHILRHTFISLLAMRGAPARAIQKLAGVGPAT